MRMAYSESLFVFLTILAMYGMARRWPLWAIASVVGLATATRFAGLALLLPLGMYIWSKSGSVKRAVAIPPIQEFGSFGDWPRTCSTNGAVQRAAGVHQDAGLLAFPCARKTVATSCLGWPRGSRSGRHIFPPGQATRGTARSVRRGEPAVRQPGLFRGGGGAVALGAGRAGFRGLEIALAAGVLPVGYAAKGFEMCMASQGRFVATAFPIYIVLGQILVRIPRPCAIAILALFAAYLGIYSAMLAAGYVLI